MLAVAQRGPVAKPNWVCPASSLANLAIRAVVLVEAATTTQQQIEPAELPRRSPRRLSACNFGGLQFQRQHQSQRQLQLQPSPRILCRPAPPHHPHSRSHWPNRPRQTAPEAAASRRQLAQQQHQQHQQQQQQQQAYLVPCSPLLLRHDSIVHCRRLPLSLPTTSRRRRRRSAGVGRSGPASTSRISSTRRNHGEASLSPLHHAANRAHWQAPALPSPLILIPHHLAAVPGERHEAQPTLVVPARFEGSKKHPSVVSEAVSAAATETNFPPRLPSLPPALNLHTYPP